MKKFFMGLSLILGFSAAWALDGTLHIQSNVKHPQTGQTITIDLGTYVFDVFKGRRELVREVYNICKNPPEKIKTFLANRSNLGVNRVEIYFNNLKAATNYKHLLLCNYGQGKLSDFNGIGNAHIFTHTTLDEIISENADYEFFSDNFAMFIDSARAEAKEKGVSFTKPNKPITIKFGSRTINPETGAEGIATYPSLDYEFNISDDRRELIKKVWEVCAIKLYSTKLKEIYKDNKKPTSVSVWYQLPNGLAEFESLKCSFNNNGTYQGYYGEKFNDYHNGKISADEISKEQIEKWANERSTLDSKWFNHEFMTLMDAADIVNSKSSQKSSTKAKK